VTVFDETPGVARARNRAWQAASAPVVVFTNDDCYLPVDYVDRIADAFAADERLAFLGGAVIRHDPGDDKLGNVSRPEPLDISPGMFLTPGALITANLAFRRDVLQSIGGFDEVFAYGNGLVGDDSDAVARISILGWRGRFDPELVVRHHHGRRSEEDIRRVQHGYDAGRGAFYAKCLLDAKLRRLYLKGWARLTAESLRRDGAGPTARELGGAVRYLGIRFRQRAWGGTSDGAAEASRS
jgi:GT2 family glycosyltransferase